MKKAPKPNNRNQAASSNTSDRNKEIGKIWVPKATPATDVAPNLKWISKLT